MANDPRAIQILGLLRDGLTYVQVAAALGITRQAIEKRIKKRPEFAAEVLTAREAGKAIREFGIWFRHPFRGKRPPTGKGHGGVPRFGVKRRRMG